MELVDTGENLSGLSVQTLGQTPIKTANKSCKYRSDSCVFDWSISVSAIHAPSVPLRSSQLACSVPSEHPVTDSFLVPSPGQSAEEKAERGGDNRAI